MVRNPSVLAQTCLHGSHRGQREAAEKGLLKPRYGNGLCHVHIILVKVSCRSRSDSRIGKWTLDEKATKFVIIYILTFY